MFLSEHTCLLTILGDVNLTPSATSSINIQPVDKRISEHCISSYLVSMAINDKSNKEQHNIVEQLTEEPKPRIAVAIAALTHSKNHLEHMKQYHWLLVYNDRDTITDQTEEPLVGRDTMSDGWRKVHGAADLQEGNKHGHDGQRARPPDDRHNSNNRYGEHNRQGE